MLDLNYILGWTVVVFLAFYLFQIFRQSRHAFLSGWVILPVVNVALLLAGVVFFPELAGVLSFAFFCVFVLLPNYLLTQIQKCCHCGDYARAGQLSRVLICLHPFDHMWLYPKYIQALNLLDKLQFEEAEQLITQIKHQNKQMGDAAYFDMKRAQGDWEWMIDQSEKLNQGDYLRALGEVGRYEEMVQYFDTFQKSQKWITLERNIFRLILFSFCGRIDILKELYQNKQLLQYVPEGSQEYWLANAEFLSGNKEGAKQRFEKLKIKFPKLTPKIERRLSQIDNIKLPTLSAESIAILENERQKIDHEALFQPKQKKLIPVVTYSLVGSCILVYIMQYFMGAYGEHLNRLVDMGAMVPSLVINGEWWRMLSAQFLHVNLMHLSLNMLCLLLLGPFVERYLGSWRFLLVYLLSGTLAAGAIVLMTYFGWLENAVNLGASLGAMGVIGAILAIIVYEWLHHGNLEARSRLTFVVIVIIWQTLFDLFTPEISMTGHLSGILFGFLLTLLFKK